MKVQIIVELESGEEQHQDALREMREDIANDFCTDGFAENVECNFNHLMFDISCKVLDISRMLDVMAPKATNDNDPYNLIAGGFCSEQEGIEDKEDMFDEDNEDLSHDPYSLRGLGNKA